MAFVIVGALICLALAWAKAEKQAVKAAEGWRESAEGWHKAVQLNDKILETWKAQIKYGWILEQVLIQMGVPEPPCGWVFQDQVEEMGDEMLGADGPGLAWDPRGGRDPETAGGG